MFSVSDSGDVLFSKGSKPFSIESAQRQVRAAYVALCKNKVEKNHAEANASVYMLLGNRAPTVLNVDPLYPAVASSAARLYCSKVGASLAARVMYSMDIYIPLSVLKKATDISPSLIAKLEETGREEFRFLARLLS